MEVQVATGVDDFEPAVDHVDVDVTPSCRSSTGPFT
jgi:hypothetical protein